MWHPKSSKPEADMDLEVARYLRNLCTAHAARKRALLLSFLPWGFWGRDQLLRLLAFVSPKMQWVSVAYSCCDCVLRAHFCMATSTVVSKQLYSKILSKCIVIRSRRNENKLASSWRFYSLKISLLVRWDTSTGAELPWVWTQVGLESKTEERSFGEREILGEETNHEGNWTNPSWQLLVC